MKIRGRREDKEEMEQLDLPEKKGEEKGKKKKKVEAEGSRWAALILLFLTLIFSLWFYLQGNGGFKNFSQEFMSLFSGFGGESTYVFVR
jgi:hypothetical protein